MITLSKTATIGIKVCRLLMKHDALSCDQLVEILNESPNTLSKACQKMRVAGILKARTGPGGGYSIETGPLGGYYTTVDDVVQALGGYNIAVDEIRIDIKRKMERSSIIHLEV
jgi:DNA-binding IscR family transcriptional regulator